MWGIGSLSPNEIRSNEDLNAYKGGDEHFMQLSYGTVKTIIDGINQQKTLPTANNEEQK
jgi:hypothetical protein